MMMKYLLVTCALCCLIATSLAGQLQLVEAPGAIYHSLNINTPDGGALLVGTEACYVPGGLAIEGCAYARHLTRLDANADTLWTNAYPANNATSSSRVFANADGGFTLFGTSQTSWSCGGVGIGGPFGWSQFEVVRVDAAGELMNRFVTDNECSLGLKDVVRIAEDRYVVIAVYANTQRFIEVRSMVMNGNGEVLRQRISEPRSLFKLGMKFNEDQNIELHYYQDSLQVREIMDTLFQTIGIVSSPNLLDLGAIENANNASTNIWGDNGSLYQLWTRQYSNPRRFVTRYLRYNSDMNLVAHGELPIMSKLEDVRLHPNGELWCVTTDTEEDDGDIAYYIIDTLGNIVGNEIVRLPGKQEPRSLNLRLDSLTLLIAGNQNCCGLPADIGRSKTFYYTFGTTATDDPGSVAAVPEFRIYPNPASEKLYVRPLAGQALQGLRIRLFDAAGRLHQDAAADQVIPLTGLTSGVYWYQLIGADGILQTGKVIRK